MLASTYRTGPSDLSDLGVAGEPGRLRAQEQKTPRFGLPGSAPRLRIKDGVSECSQSVPCSRSGPYLSEALPAL